MTNGETIRTLDNEGIATLILCVKCWVKQKSSCRGKYYCPKWREFVEYLDEETEVIILKPKPNG